MTALATLDRVLNDLTAALESGRAEAVLAVEVRLAEAIEAVRRSPDAPPADVAARVASMRHSVDQCRRLGETVPALLQVMFPGQAGYAPSGRGRGGAPPAVRGAEQVG